MKPALGRPATAAALLLAACSSTTPKPRQLGVVRDCQRTGASAPLSAAMPRVPLASVECLVAGRLWRALVARGEPANFVYSPHAVLRGLLQLGRTADLATRSELEALLGVELAVLERDVASADARFGQFFGYWPELALRHPKWAPPSLRPRPEDTTFAYSASVSSVANGRSLITSIDVMLAGTPAQGRAPAALAFRADSQRAPTLIAAATLTGDVYGPFLECRGHSESISWAVDVPGLARPTPLASPEARTERADVMVTSLRSVDPVSLLCERSPSGSRLVDAALTLSIPLFDVATDLELGDVAPALGIEQLVGPARSLDSLRARARLRLYPQGSFNTERALSTPGTTYALGQSASPAAAELNEPFAVTVRDTLTGTIFYVARVARPAAPPSE